MLTLLVADSCAQMLQRLCILFSLYPCEYSIIGQVTTGQDLLFMLAQMRKLPEFILLAIQMPKIDGIMAMHYIKHTYPGIKIIALATHGTELAIRQCIYAGSDGYVLKTAAEKKLIAAIHAVGKGELYIDGQGGLDEGQISSLLKFKEQVTWIDRTSTLTRREKEFLILNAMPSLSYEQIASLMYVTPNTIHTYFKRIAQRFDVHGRHELAMHSLQNGFVQYANLGILV